MVRCRGESRRGGNSPIRSRMDHLGTLGRSVWGPIVSPFLARRSRRKVLGFGLWFFGGYMQRRGIHHASRRCVAVRGEPRSSPIGLRRIGVLLAITADDPEIKRPPRGLLRRVSSNWVGPSAKNVQIDYRWAGNNADNMRKYAAELIALAPRCHLSPIECIRRTVATGNPALFRSCSQLSPIRSVPATSIVWRGRAGNATGF